MIVLITGGSGFIGSALARSFTNDGHKPIILTRNANQIIHPIDGAEYLQWDGKTSTGWYHRLNGADAIINLAGENLSGGRWTKERKERFVSSRLNAGKAVIEAIQKVENKPPVLIQASAVGYYGSCGDYAITENSPSGSDFLANLCVQWENSTAIVEEMGVRRVIIRTGVPLSSQGGALGLLTLPFRLFAGGPIGSGNQWFPWIHINDQINAIRFLLENERLIGPFNLSSPEPVTNKNLARTIGKILRRPSFLHTPDFAIRLVLGEMATIVLSSQKLLPKRLLENGFHFSFPVLKDALNDVLK